MKHFRRIQLHIIGLGPVNTDSAPRLLGHQLPVHGQVHNVFFHSLLADSQKVHGSFFQNLLRQKNVALAHGLLQNIEQTAADPIIGIRMNPHLRGDLIGDPEAHAVDIVRHLVGIFFDDLINVVSILIVNLHTQSCGDAVLLEKDHGFSHILLLFHLSRNLPGLFLTDALDLGQPLRLLLHNPEGVLMELPHDPGCQGDADAFHRPGTQVPLNGELVLGGLDFQSLDLKLATVGGMILVMAGDLHQLAVSNIMKQANAGDLLPVRDHVHHSVAVILIPVNDMIHISFDPLHQASSFLPPDTSST